MHATTLKSSVFGEWLWCIRKSLCTVHNCFVHPNPLCHTPPSHTPPSASLFSISNGYHFYFNFSVQNQTKFKQNEIFIHPPASLCSSSSLCASQFNIPHRQLFKITHVRSSPPSLCSSSSSPSPKSSSPSPKSSFIAITEFITIHSSLETTSPENNLAENHRRCVHRHHRLFSFLFLTSSLVRHSVLIVTPNAVHISSSPLNIPGSIIITIQTKQTTK